MNTIYSEISQELVRAQKGWPYPNLNMVALTEEVGELAKALLDEPRNLVRKEAVQVAVMAIRVGTEGDPTFIELREDQKLDMCDGGIDTIFLTISKELEMDRLTCADPSLSMSQLTRRVGLLVQALFSKSWLEVRQEAARVAASAIRVTIDGDPSLDAHRKERGLN